jgi:hypothetical protein
MRHGIWRAGPALLWIVSAGGCVGPTVDTVPWWKGIPHMVIAPSSLEGMVWRDHFRERHARRSGYHGQSGYADGWGYPAMEFYDFDVDAFAPEEVPHGPPTAELPLRWSEEGVPAVIAPPAGAHEPSNRTLAELPELAPAARVLPVQELDLELP